MKTTRPKSTKSKSNQPAPAAAAGASSTAEQTMSARLEEVMKSLAETAQKTSDPVELLGALLKIIPLNQGK